MRNPDLESGFRAGLHGRAMVFPLILALMSLGSSHSPASEDAKTIFHSHESTLGRSMVAAGAAHAVIVGVSKYSHSKIPPLKVAAKDAEDFANFLRTQRKLFRNIHIELLTDEKATKREIEKQLFYGLRQAGKDDTVILFFSGHGAADANMPGEFFFLTHDAEPDMLEASALNLSRMKFLTRLDSKRVLLIADTCHAGGFSVRGVKSGEGSIESFVRKFKESEGRIILSSCRPDEASLEMPEVGNSIFTHSLLSGLRGRADRNRDGVVTLQEAYEFMYEATKTASKGVQHPQLEGKFTGEFPLSYVGGQGATLGLVTQPPGVDVYLRDKAGFTFVDKSDDRGRLLLADLPCSRQLFVMLKKDGWKDTILGPFVLSKAEGYQELPLTKLEPALGFLALKTSPPNVGVWLGNTEMGITDAKGILMLDNVNVGVSHKFTLKKEGFHDATVEIKMPASYEGKIYSSALIELQKIGERVKPGAVAPAGLPDTSKHAGEATVKKVDMADGCLCIRKGPSGTSEKIGCAALNEKLQMTGVRSPNNWIEISEPMKGWVYANQISAAQLPPFPAAQIGQRPPEGSIPATGQKPRTKRDDDDEWDESPRQVRRSQKSGDEQEMMMPPQQMMPPQMYPQGRVPYQQMRQQRWGGQGYQQMPSRGGVMHFRR